MENRVIVDIMIFFFELFDLCFGIFIDGLGKFFVILVDLLKFYVVVIVVEYDVN